MELRYNDDKQDGNGCQRRGTMVRRKTGMVIVINGNRMFTESSAHHIIIIPISQGD